MHTHISQFIETQGLFNEKQGGFRKGKSTITTVAILTDDILLGLNEKVYTVATFMDFKQFNGLHTT